MMYINLGLSICWTISLIKTLFWAEKEGVNKSTYLSRNSLLKCGQNPHYSYLSFVFLQASLYKIIVYI